MKVSVKFFFLNNLLIIFLKAPIKVTLIIFYKDSSYKIGHNLSSTILIKENIWKINNSKYINQYLSRKSKYFILMPTLNRWEGRMNCTAQSCQLCWAYFNLSVEPFKLDTVTHLLFYFYICFVALNFASI